MISVYSCSKTSSAISQEDMAHIYVDMLMRDQWINSNYSERTNADTSFVYATILEDYGYTRDDYIESVNFYVNHPEILTKIMERTISLLSGREMVVENLIKQQEEHVRDSIFRVQVKARLDSVIRSLPSPDWKYSDSLYKFLEPKYRFAHIYSEEYKLRKTIELDRLALDSIKVATMEKDSLQLDSLEKKSSFVDSLMVKEKGDTTIISLLQKELNIIDSLLTIVKEQSVIKKKLD